MGHSNDLTIQFGTYSKIVKIVNMTKERVHVRLMKNPNHFLWVNPRASAVSSITIPWRGDVKDINERIQVMLMDSKRSVFLWQTGDFIWHGRTIDERSWVPGGGHVAGTQKELHITASGIKLYAYGSAPTPVYGFSAEMDNSSEGNSDLIGFSSSESEAEEYTALSEIAPLLKSAQLGEPPIEISNDLSLFCMNMENIRGNGYHGYEEDTTNLEDYDSSAESISSKGQWRHIEAWPIACGFAPKPNMQKWKHFRLYKRFPPTVYITLNHFSGVMSSVRSNHFQAARTYEMGSFSDKEDVKTNVVEWITLLTLAVSFLQVFLELAQSLKSVFVSWDKFEKWFETGGQNPSQKNEPAKKVAKSPSELDDKADKIAKDSGQAATTPTDDSSHTKTPPPLKDQSYDTEVIQSVLENSPFLVHPRMARGMSIVLKYDNGSTYNLYLNSRQQRAVTQRLFRPEIRLPNSDRITDIFVGFYQDYNDFNSDWRLAGDMHGVINFHSWN